MRRIWIALAALAMAHAAAAANTTVILVRHAERASTDTDSPLSAAGTQRATELARVLAGTHLDAIYITQYARTRQTAEPIASATKLTPIAMEAGGGKPYAANIVKRIRAENAGQTVLVVGHSNTTRDVLKELGVANAPEIADSEYDDLFICTLADGAPPSLVSLRYGIVAR